MYLIDIHSVDVRRSSEVESVLAVVLPSDGHQTAERLEPGEAYSELGYVVCNEAGEPYHPSTM